VEVIETGETGNEIGLERLGDAVPWSLVSREEGEEGDVAHGKSSKILR